MKVKVQFSENNPHVWWQGEWRPIDTGYVRLPSELVAFNKYPGYFYHLSEHAVYSIKIGGTLKRLSTKSPNVWCKITTPYVTLSRQCIKVNISLDKVRELVLKNGPAYLTIPYQKQVIVSSPSDVLYTLYATMLGKYVRKISGKPFDSGVIVNRVKGIILDLVNNKIMFTFVEDESVVRCEKCECV